jgi:hypothetical protein
MIGAKITLVGGASQKIVDASKGTGKRSVLIKTALTDLCFGGPAVTSSTGYLTAAAITNLSIDCGADDLWAVSAAGGDVYVLYPENG